jgi:hypothetical protein
MYKVYAAGRAIKRGIERDIPLYRKDRYGRRQPFHATSSVVRRRRAKRRR